MTVSVIETKKTKGKTHAPTKHHAKDRLVFPGCSGVLRKTKRAWTLSKSDHANLLKAMDQLGDLRCRRSRFVRWFDAVLTAIFHLRPKFFATLLHFYAT